MRSFKHTLAASGLSVFALAFGLGAGVANAALEGRDLDGNATTAEAYYDTTLDVTWLANANYAATFYGNDIQSLLTWSQANTFADNLSFTGNGTTYDNWRLPTVGPVGSDYNLLFKFDGTTDYGYNISAPGTAFAGSTAPEMANLYYNTLGNAADCDTSNANSCGNFTQSNGILNNPGPFTNFQDYIYWSGTTNPDESNNAFSFYFNDGFQDASTSKSNNFHALFVTFGDIGEIATPVPEADTWLMLLAGLGLVGVMTRRRG